MVNTVNLSTATGYDEHIRKFVEWAHFDDIKSIPAEKLEPMIIEYLESLYFEGANHDAGDRLMSALEYRDRRLRKGAELDMHKVREALRGFRRLAPGLSRAPLPYVALCGIIGAAVSINRRDFGLALLIQFCGYFRPSELLAITADRLIPPQRFSGSTAWAVLLSPQEEAIGSKTHEFDESVLLDWEIFNRLTPVLYKLKARPPGSSIWDFNYVQYLEMFRTCSELSMVNYLNPHPYSIRHGGASDDALRGSRSLAQIKARGRWKSDNSVRRYEKHARVLREVERMPNAAQVYGGRIMTQIVKVLSNPDFSVKPPGNRSTLRHRLPADARPGTPAKRLRRLVRSPAAST